MSLPKHRVAFLGGMYPKEMHDEIEQNSIRGLQTAANNLQWSFIDGLDFLLENPLTLVSCLFVGSYPVNHRFSRVQKQIFHHKPESVDYLVGFNNRVVIRHFSMLKNTWRTMIELLKDDSLKPEILLVYSTNYINIEIARRIKKRFENIKVVIIVPDLMIYTSQRFGRLSPRGLFRSFQDWLARRVLPKLDGYIFLTKPMAEYYGITNNYLVIEGVADQSIIESHRTTLSDEDGKKRRIVYTGGLSELYGVKNLLDAFRMIEGDEYELILCGDGELSSAMHKYTDLDPRIQYLGILPRQDVLELQRSATILVNPRRDEAEYTAYSFPSKIIEYMSSGVPVICYKLRGIPDEYDEFLIYFRGCSVSDIRNGLVDACDISQKGRLMIGRRAYDFIKEKKSAKKQMIRVLDYLEQLL